jgi:hypothetical protein
MFNRTRIMIAAMSALVLLAAGVVRAETLNYSQSYYGDPNWDQTLSIPQFNPSDGTLDSVSLQITGSGTASLAYQNNSSSSTTNKVFLDLTWEVERTDSTVLLNDTKEWYVNWSSASGASYNAGPWNTAPTPTDLTYTTPADLAYFTGSGSADFLASGSNSVMESLSGGNFTISTPNSLGVTVAVTYNYTPVPEPSILVLLGLSAIGLLAYARRRK